MRITIESTNTTTVLDGTECRIWEGVTEGGAKVRLFITRLQVHVDQDTSEFERDLIEKPPPLKTVPLRLLI